MYWVCPVVAIFCMFSIYAEALGYPVSVDRFASILVGLVFVFIGNYLPKCKHNYTVGIKIPWTLNSEENWNRTHRFAGPIWVICGILFMALTFIGYAELSVVIILIAVLVPMIYSYMYYRKHELK